MAIPTQQTHTRRMEFGLAAETWVVIPVHTPTIRATLLTIIFLGEKKKMNVVWIDSGAKWKYDRPQRLTSAHHSNAFVVGILLDFATIFCGIQGKFETETPNIRFFSHISNKVPNQKISKCDLDSRTVFDSWTWAKRQEHGFFWADK